MPTDSIATFCRNARYANLARLARFALLVAFVLGCGTLVTVGDAAEENTEEKAAEKTEPKAAKAKTMLLYVTPFYNSEGPRISVGSFSKKLSAATPSTVEALAAEMSKQWRDLPVEAMYVTAIRLYDLGHKDTAFVWYYSAAYRALLFQKLLEPKSIGAIGAPAFETSNALGAFRVLAGEYINGYGFSDLPKARAAIKQMIADNEKLPDFHAIYPKVVFIPDAEWPTKQEQVNKSFQDLITYTVDHEDALKENRKKNGVEGKY